MIIRTAASSLAKYIYTGVTESNKTRSYGNFSFCPWSTILRHRAVTFNIQTALKICYPPFIFCIASISVFINVSTHYPSNVSVTKQIPYCSSLRQTLAIGFQSTRILRFLKQTFANFLTQTRLTKGVLIQQRCYCFENNFRYSLYTSAYFVNKPRFTGAFWEFIIRRAFWEFIIRRAFWDYIIQTSNGSDWNIFPWWRQHCWWVGFYSYKIKRIVCVFTIFFCHVWEQIS